MIELEKLQAKYGLLGGPTKKTIQQELSFGKVQRSNHPNQTSGKNFIIHLCPSKNDMKARREGIAFEEFLNHQPLWIQNFRARKSHQCRNTKAEYKARAQACLTLLEAFYEQPDCSILTIVEGDGCCHTFQKSIGQPFEQQLLQTLQVKPCFKDKLYERVRLHSREYNRRIAKKPSTFVLGGGMWRSEHTFTQAKTGALTQTERKSYREFTKPSAVFSSIRFEEDTRRFGHRSLKKVVSKDGPESADVQLAPADKEEKQQLFRIVAEVEARLTEKGLVSLRSSWEDVFTTTCTSNPKVPCAKCRGCRQRFAQAVFVVIAAAGVSDENILPILGAVFRSEYYREYSIEEWSLTPIKELIQIYRPCSKQVQNAFYTHLVFQYLAPRSLPTDLRELTCLRGIEKKSACLLLQAALGVEVGIPVDRHLMTAGKALGWIPEDCNDPTKASLLLEAIVAPDQYAAMNNVVSGLCQMAAKSNQNMEFILQTAQEMGKVHHETIKKVFRKWSVRRAATKRNEPVLVPITI